MWKKIARDPRLRAWVLYEFALGPFSAFFLTLFFPIYLGQALIPDEGSADFAWGLTNSIALAIVAVSSLFIGPWIDRRGARRGFLRGTGVMWLLFCGLALWPATPLPALLLFTVAAINYQWTFIPYNAYLNDLAPKAERGQVSAFGYSAGYIGNLLAMAAAMLIFSRIGQGIGTLRWVLLLVPILGLPAFLPAVRQLPAIPPRAASGPPIWGLLKIRALLVFLIASAIYMDGMTTIIEFSGRFADVTIHMHRIDQLLGLFLILQFFAIFGALLNGRLADKLGDRPPLIAALLLWMGVIAGMGVVENRTPFYCLAALAGVGMGMVGSGTRAWLSRLIPPGREAEGFGLFAITARLGAIIGPVVFGIVSKKFGQHAAVLTILPFFIIGAILLGFMPKTVEGTRDLPAIPDLSAE
jgi:UMF1 family MFS transporter